MLDYVSREPLKWKALDRWENEGGQISREREMMKSGNLQSGSRARGNHLTPSRDEAAPHSSERDR